MWAAHKQANHTKTKQKRQVLVKAPGIACVSNRESEHDAVLPKSSAKVEGITSKSRPCVLSISRRLGEPEAKITRSAHFTGLFLSILLGLVLMVSGFIPFGCVHYQSNRLVTDSGQQRSAISHII
jgi:hypothetical protein